MTFANEQQRQLFDESELFSGDPNCGSGRADDRSGALRKRSAGMCVAGRACCVDDDDDGSKVVTPFDTSCTSDMQCVYLYH